MNMDCPYCKGRGRVKTALSMSVEIQRQIAAIMRRQKNSGRGLKLQIIVHPSVLERFKVKDEQVLVDLEAQFEGRLTFRGDPGLHHESFSIVNADTKEVLCASDR